MKKLILYVFALFSLMACGNDIEDGNEPDIVPVYKLTDIQYSLEEGDGEKEELVSWPGYSFVNETSLTQTISIPMMGEVKEGSCFSSNDMNAFPLPKADSTLVGVPGHILDNKIIKEGVRLYAEGENMQRSSTTVKRTTEVPSNCILVFKEKVRYRVLRVTYTATFIDEITRQRYTIKGKWSGSFHAGSESECTTSEIK